MTIALRSLSLAVVFGLLGATAAVEAGPITIETVPVGDPGNAGEQSRLAGYGDATFYGGVPYEYSIGKYEITGGQYTEFLNAVAATDTYALYNINMDVTNDQHGCNIVRSGSSGSYTYSVATDWEKRPVNYVSWGDAARFCNWLHNGQPTGAQGLATTEDGAYFLNGATIDPVLMTITRESEAKWFIPSEDEWYKAAYYDGSGSYYDYPTSNNSSPGYVDADTDGGGPDVPDLINSGGSDVGDFTEPCPDPDGNFATYNGGIDGIGLPYYRTEVGEWELSGSPYGTFDQGGNVEEWNETPTSDWFRGLRGGSFFDFGGLSLKASYRWDGRPTNESVVTGFRVASPAAVPEPSSMGLGVLLLGLMLTYRRR